MRIDRFAALLAVLFLLTACFACPARSAEFTDSAEIGSPYAYAVSEMAAQGVLNGFPDGRFDPMGTLTREQGAKIVTFIVLGSGVNDLPSGKAPFADVAADRWSAPCIEWCVKRGILLGYGDGRFGPDDKLTGCQFSKMLLCALGLAREGSYAGLGSAWAAAVREDGAAASLFSGDADMAADSPITRQQAALLAHNAVKAARTAEPDDPVSPTLPAEPSDPTYPTDPPEPAQPMTPTVPVQPTAPTDPVQPSRPTEPSVVTPPSVPTEPSAPTYPTAPTVPSQPAGHTGDGSDIVLPDLP